MGREPVVVLLVEDEQAHVELVHRAFERKAERFDLTVANSLKEARQCLERFRPDLVITDLLLPDGRGIEMLPPEDDGQGYPIVVMTGHGDENVAVEAMKGGALDYIVKSEATLGDMPRLAERALREWRHIKERRRAEEALRETNEILKNILSASPIGIGLVENRAIKWANEAAVEIFGFEHERDYVDKSTRILYPSEKEYERVGQTAYAELKAGGPSRVDATFKRKNGATFIGHLMMSCPDPSDPMKGTIFTISDISWRKKADEQRMQREKLEGALEMAGAVCHELSQPMQVACICSERVLRATPQDSPLHVHAGRIADKIAMMAEITRKLQNIARYKTKDYIKGTKIIDIDQATDPSE